MRTALANPVDKNVLSADQQRLRAIFGRSLVAARPLCAGDTVLLSDLAFKKPGGGLSYDQILNVVGKKLRRNMSQDDELLMEDLY